MKYKIIILILFRKIFVKLVLPNNININSKIYINNCQTIYHLKH